MNVGPSPARARVDRLARRLVDREHVRPVDAQARHPVPDRLVREGRRGRLRRERRRDRPLVVVAEEDYRRLHDPGEGRPLVERALGCRAVAEERERDAVLPFQLRAPGEPDRVRHLRRDRHADRRNAVVLRVPPARGMPAPPGEHRRDRHPAQEPDRRLAVSREDPVALLEREHRTRLHRLVIPVDRVRPDAALAVVHDRPLVVGAEEDEIAVEREQVLRREPVDLAVRLALAVADDAAQPSVRRKHLGHLRGL